MHRRAAAVRGDAGERDPDRGADLSFEPQEEAAGAQFSDNGVPSSPLAILDRHGMNYVRLRLWVNPPPGYSILARDLQMARRIKAAGDKLYLDIQYSDFWADPQHQNIPGAWQGQDLQQLTTTVRDYTRRVLGAFAAQGTPVDMVSIGNEIRNGILWPIGQVNWSTNTGWSNLTTLLKAGVACARAGDPPGHKLLVMLHFDQGGDNADSRTFFDHMVSGGVRFDVIGLSYYPFFHGPLTAMRANVDDLATRYHKPIVIAESQYPWTLANGDSTGNFVWQSSQLSAGYPASPAGQLSFYNDALSILAQVPDHLGRGLSIGSRNGSRAWAGSRGPDPPTTISRCSRSPDRPFPRSGCSRARWRCASATTPRRCRARSRTARPRDERLAPSPPTSVRF